MLIIYDYSRVATQGAELPFLVFMEVFLSLATSVISWVDSGRMSFFSNTDIKWKVFIMSVYSDLQRDDGGSPGVCASPPRSFSSSSV